MRALFPTPLTATPVETTEGRRFQIEGQADFGAIFAIDSDCRNSASPTGFATLLRSEQLAETWALSLTLVA